MRKVAASCEVVDAVQVARNQQHLLTPQDAIDPGMVTSLHLDLLQAPQLAIYIQVTLMETHVPLLVIQSEALPRLHTLQVNLKVQGANYLLNNMFNIVRQENSHALKYRLQHLKESLHSTSSHINTNQEAAL